MNDITYIMSGASMALKPGMGDKQDDYIYSDMVSDTIAEFDSGVNYEIMFNAYNEVRAMENYFAKYNYFGTKWHADSGGLQMITLGKEITDELKEKVYNVQAKYSSYAMCFDELPIYVSVLKGRQARIDLSGRHYIVEWAEQKAINTGLNVKKQIEVFRKLKSESKVFLICQGNNIYDFVEFYNNAMSVIPKEYYSSIAGIALSAACTGLGTLEAIQMLGSYGFMDIPKEIGNKLHVLGFGSLKRLYPLLLLKESGYIDRDITFDSSSHAIKPILGDITVEKCDLFPNGGEITIGQKGHNVDENMAGYVENHDSEKIFKYLYDKYGHILQKYYKMDFDEYHNIVNVDLMTSARYNLTCKRSVTVNLYQRWLIAFESCYNFGKSIVKARDDMRNGTFDSGIPAINDLSKVKTTKNFTKWFKAHSNHLATNSISRYETLDEVTEKKASALPI